MINTFWKKKVCNAIEVPGDVEMGGDLRKVSTCETIQNRIYFYSDITREDILTLNRDIRNVNNELLSRAHIEQLSIDSQKVYLHIQSFGGDIFAGLSAMDNIRNSRIPITTIVDGCCASSATFLTIVGKRRLMYEHSFMMVHQLSTLFWGSYQQLLDEKDNCDLLMSTIKKVYNEFTKIPNDIIDNILQRDVWFDAKQCIEYGMVDEVIKVS